MLTLTRTEMLAVIIGILHKIKQITLHRETTQHTISRRNPPRIAPHLRIRASIEIDTHYIHTNPSPSVLFYQ